MKLKILIGTSSFGKADPKPIRLLQDHGLDVITNPYGRKLTREELIRLLQGVDGLLAGLEPVDRGVLEASTLKVVSRCGAGISNVDVDACRELGVVFRYTPFGPTQAVSELTVGMIIMMLRQVFVMHAGLGRGEWNKQVGVQLKGKTVAIVGYGRIGRRTASLLSSFGAEILAVDPALEEAVDSVRIMGLDEALTRADIVVLHASGEGEIIGGKELALMQLGSFLCNVGRGGNVNEAALAVALTEQKIAGAWLDCFSKEPYHGPLCGLPNVLLTPHVASYTAEGRLEMEMEAAGNLIEGLSGVASNSIVHD